MSSPSPQTVMPGKFLNQRPVGTSGSVSSHCARRMIWSWGISRSRTRSKRCRSNASGNSLRRTLGMWFAAVKPAHNFFPQLAGNNRVFCLDHLVCQFAQFFAGKLPFTRKLKRESDHLSLFSRWQVLDFFNHLVRAHDRKITQPNLDRQGAKCSVSRTRFN